MLWNYLVTYGGFPGGGLKQFSSSLVYFVEMTMKIPNNVQTTKNAIKSAIACFDIVNSPFLYPQSSILFGSDINDENSCRIIL